jgi:DNA-binding CsgD family transcriptional regulator/PAS domain-containing protein
VRDGSSGIRQLYDGLWDASSWQAGLDHVCASLRGHHLVSFTTAAAEGEERPVCWAVHVAEPHINALLRHADEVSVFTRGAPLHRAIPGEVLAPPRVLMRTELYRSVIRPMGGHYGAFALPFAGGVLAVCRPPTAEPFGHREIGRLQAWLPHLETVLRLKRHLLAVGRRGVMIEEELEHLDVGIIMLDRTGRVLHANQSAEAAMQDDAGDGASPGVLRQVRAICDCPDGCRHAISRGPSRWPLVARAVPFGGPSGERLPAGVRANVVVFLRDPERQIRDTASVLREGFRLTPREASLAELLARGLSLAEAAEMLGISRGNARVHLKRVFSKTGLRRQAELVSLILRLQL